MEMLRMTVFEALPQGIERWQIASLKKSTLTGDIFSDPQALDVIADEGSSTGAETTSAEAIRADTLLYAKPEQMPTTNPATLVAGFGIISPDGEHYAIIEAGKGKNQQTGALEHIELRIRQIGA